MKFFVLTILSIAIFAFEPPSGVKPTKETYKFVESPVRQNVTKFLTQGLYISSHCLSNSGKTYLRRECKAWYPLDLIESGEYKKLFTPDKIYPDVTKVKSIAIQICVRSKGFINTEVNEFGKFSRGETLDFCQYEDDSSVALRSLEFLLITSQKNSPKQKNSIEEKNKTPENLR